MPEAPRLLDQARDRIRLLHYSYRTKQAYLGWIRRYIPFHGKRHPRKSEKEAKKGTDLFIARRYAARAVPPETCGILLENVTDDK